jgi:phosphohistidine phosphatase SixA
MNATARAVIAAAALVPGLTTCIDAAAQTAADDALVKVLRQGGYVMVMRHASSPGETPSRQTANADNVKLERQLDESGRRGAGAMGDAVRDLGIPVGDVLTSPTYRAQETVRLARLPNPQVHAELGDTGKSMQGVSDEQAAWLRQRASAVKKGANTIIVTHLPNISRAFPAWDEVAQGEVVVVGPDGKGGVRTVGRIRIEEWPRLR